jgi:hypothetical protein
MKLTSDVLLVLWLSMIGATALPTLSLHGVNTDSFASRYTDGTHNQQSKGTRKTPLEDNTL